jgi:hypothetical protein
LPWFCELDTLTEFAKAELSADNTIGPAIIVVANKTVINTIESCFLVIDDILVIVIC